MVRRVGKLQALAADEDIYDAGLSSVGALQLFPELEDQFDVSFPDDRFIACGPRAR